MDGQLVKGFRDRWQEVEAIEIEEQRMASVALRWQQLNAIFRLALGLGMTFGELPNSFLKRQLGILPGKRKKGILGWAFFLLDQVDLAIGIWICLFFLIKPSLWLILWSLALAVPLHLLVSGIGYALGMRRTLT